MITETLWSVIDLACQACGIDVARVVTREDYEKVRDGAVGSAIAEHMLKFPPSANHLATVRDLQMLTWDQLNAPPAADGSSEAGS